MDVFPTELKSFEEFQEYRLVTAHLVQHMMLV